MKCLTAMQKLRIFSLLVLLILLFISVLGYAYELTNSEPLVDYAEEVYVDGENFTPIANLFMSGANGILQIIEYFAICCAMLVISLALLVPWKCIAIRKNSIVEKIECKISVMMLIAFMIFSLITSFIITHFSNILMTIFLICIPSILYLLFCIIPLYFTNKRVRTFMHETEKS